MSFDIAKYLGRATSRAKSDVANKMISMFLHEISRRIVSEVGLRITDSAYALAVAETFGDKCVYCRRPLELNRAAVEHLDGMNRFRVGLHIPGNATVACVTCNREKRRDDQMEKLVLAKSGWESFLAHDSGRCPSTCQTCRYWKTVWSDQLERTEMLTGLSLFALENRFFRGASLKKGQCLWGFLPQKAVGYRPCPFTAA
jgi:hypothetical protein